MKRYLEPPDPARPQTQDGVCRWSAPGWQDHDRPQPAGKRSAGLLNWDVPAQRELILRQTFPRSNLWVFDETTSTASGATIEGCLRRTHTVATDPRHGQRPPRLYPLWRRLTAGALSLPAPASALRRGARHPFSQGLRIIAGLGRFSRTISWRLGARSAALSNEYRSRLVREDLTSLEQVQDIGSVELLMMRLPELVGSPLSVMAFPNNWR